MGVCGFVEVGVCGFVEVGCGFVEVGCGFVEAGCGFVEVCVALLRRDVALFRCGCRLGCGFVRSFSCCQQHRIKVSSPEIKPNSFISLTRENFHTKIYIPHLP